MEIAMSHLSELDLEMAMDAGYNLEDQLIIEQEWERYNAGVYKNIDEAVEAIEEQTEEEVEPAKDDEQAFADALDDAFAAL